MRTGSSPPERGGADKTRRAILADGVILCLRMGGGDDVRGACRAALEGGLRVLEVTLTTPGAPDVIRWLSENAASTGAIPGAGTVLTRAQVREVAAAGGRFVLSPVFDFEVLEEARRHELLAIPGAATPREILAAHQGGAPMVKVFPAGALGGPDYLRAVRGPLPGIALVPTSGPTAKTIGAYVEAGAVAVGVGREVFPAGWTPREAAAGARRVRDAMDRARARHP